jgi:hypothetical protein
VYKRQAWPVQPWKLGLPHQGPSSRSPRAWLLWQVAEALRERAQRVYERYGTVMVNMEGMSQVCAHSSSWLLLLLPRSP